MNFLMTCVFEYGFLELQNVLNKNVYLKFQNSTVHAKDKKITDKYADCSYCIYLSEISMFDIY